MLNRSRRRHAPRSPHQRVPSRYRLSRACATCVAAQLTACVVQQQPVSLPTPENQATEPQRVAPGIAVDRAFERPAPAFQGRVQDQLVTLIPRAGDAEIQELVASLFQAISKEAGGQLRLLFTDESTASFPGAENQTAHVSWLRRFNKGRYGALSSQLMYREDAIEIYRATDLAVLRSRGRLYFVPNGDDLVVVVPLVSPTVGGERLFGTELQLLVSSESGGLKVRASYEDYVLQ